VHLPYRLQVHISRQRHISNSISMNRLKVSSQRNILARLRNKNTVHGLEKTSVIWYLLLYSVILKLSFESFEPAPVFTTTPPNSLAKYFHPLNQLVAMENIRLHNFSRYPQGRLFDIVLRSQLFQLFQLFQILDTTPKTPLGPSFLPN
jgi:hypothetical protein